MPISDLCSKKFISVEASASLQQAAQIMKKNNIGGLVVVESNGKNKPVGILTDRDIVLSTVAENLPASTAVRNIMSKEVVTVTNKTGIAEVVDQMEKRGVRRMVVVDNAGNACGIVSSDDILQLISREMNGLGRLVQKQTRSESPEKSNEKMIM